MKAERTGSQDPFASALIEGCLDKGVDYFQGGTKNGSPIAIMAQGLGTAADSLAAIKQLVFEKKEITLEQLSKAMLADFEGYELLRYKLEKAPSYGNDNDYVDSIAVQIFDTYSARVKEQNQIYKLDNARFVNNVFSYNLHIELGEVTDATPNGRKKAARCTICRIMR